MNQLGTILPRKGDAQLAQKEFEARQKQMALVAKTSPELKGLQRRIVGKEVRFYNGDNQYALVSHHHGHAILWFTKGADGYFYSGKTVRPLEKCEK